jgi:tRNA (mo5U34)-methyltransferase
MTATADLRARARELSWYHTIDLGDGIVTPGFFDTRSTVGRVPLPGSLAGKRCLDVGTWDGFWAFELERRGAVSVTAVDIEDPDRWDWPPHSRLGKANADRLRYLADFKSGGDSFALAKEALGSAVERIDCSVYDLSPERVGTFDFVFLGSLLLHLRDPVGALAAVRSVCAGEAVIADTVEAIPTLLRPRTPTARLAGLGEPWWWQPNAAALRRMIESAGFEVLERSGLYFLPVGAGHPPAPLRRSLRGALRSAEGREKLIIRLRGIPHVAVRARPVG